MASAPTRDPRSFAPTAVACLAILALFAAGGACAPGSPVRVQNGLLCRVSCRSVSTHSYASVVIRRGAGNVTLLRPSSADARALERVAFSDPDLARHGNYSNDELGWAIAIDHNTQSEVIACGNGTHAEEYTVCMHFHDDSYTWNRLVLMLAVLCLCVMLSRRHRLRREARDRRGEKPGASVRWIPLFGGPPGEMRLHRRKAKPRASEPRTPEREREPAAMPPDSPV
ncbi:membrane protein Mo3 [Beluga whale alphaherpesvirus 1]|uniref:Membrane protein Mo3 n=1 Tax=Beluga whale alphaherpesvirus 1 TaxID=1434720 RepID=A0A286MM99_9ALPH|nr:membrane protein Mo3 [Beluga whale alphaherpesvirus 1]YP_010084994.1 membrane protein Mo3 [Beluga whale alphaherpesvirus 1]ASW27117.1 membrane protein Mo3 [Beluga whale alphaherpesvirus 1]ASW27125.1 membrane protein Mo3 [Beluga whale alphaherpesvirus 1]